MIYFFGEERARKAANARECGLPGGSCRAFVIFSGNEGQKGTYAYTDGAMGPCGGGCHRASTPPLNEDRSTRERVDEVSRPPPHRVCQRRTASWRPEECHASPRLDRDGLTPRTCHFASLLHVTLYAEA